mmetsp:Transcript_21879/g.33932  ORF Transcript_21879/g.33932 Transcript_21879/m.33932 type:complete len:124 (+) Transcript_21879:3277-3648(+)
MIPKKLFYRREYSYTTNNTVPSNYYPVTSALAVRDFNQSNLARGVQKQILIMNDRSQGATAGLRGNKNIEFMQQRRFQVHDHYGVLDALNELDQWGKGISVKANYYMQLTNVANSSAPKASFS